MNPDPASFHHSESLPHGPTIRLRAIRPSDREQISDQEMVTMVQRLLRDEGWLSGSSTGVNVCGAVEMAHQLGPGHRIRDHALRWRQQVSFSPVQFAMAEDERPDSIPDQSTLKISPLL